MGKSIVFTSKWSFANIWYSVLLFNFCILLIFLQSNYRTVNVYCVHVALSGCWESNPHPLIFLVSPVFHKLYVINHIASPLQIITYFGILNRPEYKCEEALTPPPFFYSLKIISNTLCTICKLFKPLYSLFSNVTTGARHDLLVFYKIWATLYYIGEVKFFRRQIGRDLFVFWKIWAPLYYIGEIKFFREQIGSDDLFVY